MDVNVANGNDMQLGTTIITAFQSNGEPYDRPAHTSMIFAMPTEAISCSKASYSKLISCDDQNRKHRASNGRQARTSRRRVMRPSDSTKPAKNNNVPNFMNPGAALACMGGGFEPFDRSKVLKEIDARYDPAPARPKVNLDRLVARRCHDHKINAAGGGCDCPECMKRHKKRMGFSSKLGLKC
eukprot:scaffold284756_cov22-Prasinocladus_malaysianus.AAC.1